MLINHLHDEDKQKLVEAYLLEDWATILELLRNNKQNFCEVCISYRKIITWVTYYQSVGELPIINR